MYSHVGALSNFSFSLQGLQICADGGPSLPSRCVSSLAAASGNFVLGGAGTCLQLATATRFLNRWSMHFKPCLASAPMAKRTLWRVIRTQKQFTVAVIIAIIITVRYCRAAAAASVGVGLKFAYVVNFVVGMHRATSGATGGGWCGQS